MTAFALALFTIGISEPSGGYHVLLFGGQSRQNRPHTAHTWATFVKTTSSGVESFTISWLPERMPVRPLRLTPEAGRNYSLHETLDLFNTGDQELALWGPFEIKPFWYADALAHKSVLDAGGVKFQTLDRGPLLPRGPVRRPDLSHCVHAVTRTNEALRQASSPVFSYGEFITRKVATRMNDVGLLVNPEVTHDWLIPALGLDRYALHRHGIHDPVRLKH